MRIHDFIFSNARGLRLMRHCLFWLCWLIFFDFSYFIPYYWYAGWDTHILPAPVREGGHLHFYLLVLTNSVLALVVQVFFSYSITNFLLPRFLLKNRYGRFIAGLIGLLIVSIIFFFFEFKYSNPVVRSFFGRPPAAWSFREMIRCSIDMVLFNCPVVGGLAIGIKLIKYWWTKERESEQLAMAKTGAELQLLKAQIHPHFLFNTLNNIYSFTSVGSPGAPDMANKLSDLLHYIIRECDHQRVPVEKELKMIGDYMGLEKVRYDETLDLSFDVSGNFSGWQIAPLLLIPFVENSFKHGASKMLSAPFIRLRVELRENVLYFSLVNKKPQRKLSTRLAPGIGLANVKKRLELIYPGIHRLVINEDPANYSVDMQIVLDKNEMIPKVKTAKRSLHEMD